MTDEVSVIPLKEGFFSIEYTGFKKRSWHRHLAAQIIYCVKGSLRVQTKSNEVSHFWYLPVHQGLWIPSNALHAAEAERNAHTISIYVDEKLAKRFAKETIGFHVSNLLRELIIECSKIDFTKAQVKEEEARLLECLMDQLLLSKQDTLNFPLPKNPKLQKLVDILIKEPENKDSLPSLGKKIGASPKTVARLLENDLRMSFTTLRNTIKILHACKGLDSKLPIIEVVYELGFSSQAAFTTLFKKYTGVTPKQYVEGKTES